MPIPTMATLRGPTLSQPPGCDETLAKINDSRHRELSNDGGRSGVRWRGLWRLNQPISNTVIQMYAPGTNGYGSFAAPATQPVGDDGRHEHSLLHASRVCLLAFQFYARLSGRDGGQSGTRINTNNAALVMMGLAALTGPELRQLLRHQ